METLKLIIKKTFLSCAYFFLVIFFTVFLFISTGSIRCVNLLRDKIPPEKFYFDSVSPFGGVVSPFAPFIFLLSIILLIIFRKKILNNTKWLLLLIIPIFAFLPLFSVNVGFIDYKKIQESHRCYLWEGTQEQISKNYADPNYFGPAFFPDGDCIKYFDEFRYYVKYPVNIMQKMIYHYRTREYIPGKNYVGYCSVVDDFTPRPVFSEESYENEKDATKEGYRLYRSSQAFGGANFQIEYPEGLFVQELFRADEVTLSGLVFYIPKISYVIPEADNKNREYTEMIPHTKINFIDIEQGDFFEKYVDYDTELNGRWSPDELEGPFETCSVYDVDEYYCGHFKKMDQSIEGLGDIYVLDDRQVVGSYSTFNSDLYFFRKDNVGILFDGPKANYSSWWSDVQPEIPNIEVGDFKFINE